MLIHGERLDRVLNLIRLGKWQYVQAVSLMIVYLPWACGALSLVVIGFVPDFACILPVSNKMDLVNPEDQDHVITLPPGDVSFGQKCDLFNTTSNSSGQCVGELVYAEPKEASFVSSWNLVCGKEYLSELSLSIYMAGTMLGTLVFTPIADRFGRRIMIVWCHAAYLIVSLVSCVVPNISAYIAVRCLAGAVFSGASISSWVTTLELFLPKHRTMAALISNVVWATCVNCVPMVGHLMRGLNWRYLQLVFSLTSVVVVAQYFLVAESLQWLIANEKESELLQLTEKAGIMNGVDTQKIRDLVTNLFKNKPYSGEVEQQAKLEVAVISSETAQDRRHSTESTTVSRTVLVSHPKLRLITLIMGLTWFTNAMTYDGLYLLSSTLAGDRYLNIFLSTVVEIPAALALFPIVLKCGRRSSCVLVHLLAGVCLIAAAILHVTTDSEAGNTAKAGVILLGKGSISATFNLIFMYTPEMFPTNIRSQGLGVPTLMASIGGLLSPFTLTVAREVPWAPAAVFGGLCVLAAFVCQLLPETKDKDLPQTLADMDRLFQQKTPKKA